MKKTEKVLFYILIASIIVTFCRIPFGKSAFTLLCLLTMIYYLLGSFLLFNDVKVKQAFVRAAYAGIGAKEVIMSILAGISLFYVADSLLFLVNDWPIQAAGVIVFYALLFLIPCTGLCAVFYIRQKHPTYSRILRRMLLAIALLGVVLLLYYFRYNYWI